MFIKPISVFCLLLAVSAQAAANSDGEEIPADESVAVQEVVMLIRNQIESEARNQGRAFRDAHRKHHGCVKASFQVADALPDSIKYGVFSQGKTYNAVIRYSNGSGQVQDDREGDGRGMAVKVLGVTGERNLSENDDETSSQDFLMINNPVFFVRDAEDYVKFQKAVQSGDLIWWLLHPMRVLHEALIVKDIRDRKISNPLDSTYFSMTASKLGPSQMKFRAIPCGKNVFLNPSNSADRLRENLEATLAKGSACFLFQVQLRTIPEDMPVEDPTIEWNEEDAPFETVAQITIPEQKPAQGESCEALSFNPWNGLQQHRPLGGISRVRKDVYQAISRFRHEFNNQKRIEPRN